MQAKFGDERSRIGGGMKANVVSRASCDQFIYALYDMDCQHDFMGMTEPTAEMDRILSRKLDEPHRRAQKVE